MKPKDALTELQEKALKFRNERDWQQFHTPKDLAMNISIEASEILEHFLWKNEKEIKKYIKTNKNEIADEISDVLHALLLLSHDLGIDLKKSFHKKMDENGKKYPVGKSRGKHTKYTEYNK